MRALRLLAASTAMLCAAAAGQTPWNVPVPPLPQTEPPPHPKPHPKIFDLYPQQPSLTPAFTIRVGALGFHSPGSFYLLRRRALVSLDFLDENRLLFTFRKPALERRDAENADTAMARQIQALVLSLPDGKVETQALLTVPDQARYLWMLRDGHFLLRDQAGLEQCDATLKPQPYLHLPGRLLWIAMDPEQQVIVTNSLEPATAPPPTSGEAIGPSSGQAAAAAGAQKPGPREMLVVRTLRMETGKSIKESRVPWAAQTNDWPVNSQGYVESVRGNGAQWTLNLDSFSGAGKALGQVDSTCLPDAAFAAETELIVKTCVVGGGGDLTAMTVPDGARTWQAITATNAMWPQLVMAPDGSRLALETLLLKRPATAYKRKRLIGAQDLEGQMVRVMDAADGKVELEAPLRPILDGGGNVSISPSGRRVAILNDGAIEVFELPPPARMPATGAAVTPASQH